MKTNMGTTDRILRLLVAVIVAILYATDQITGATAVILLILSGVFILTSFMSFCPLYLPFGISTKKKTVK